MPIRENTARPEVLVIGAGASGTVAAICLAQAGLSVTLLDKNESPARKIRVTGNGRCNLTNLKQDPACWYTGGRDFSMEDLGAFGPGDLMGFFEERGVRFHDRDGYVYPRTDQASAIADTLIGEIRRLQIPFYGNTRVTGIHAKKAPGGGFQVFAGDRSFRGDYVILACGGMAGEAFGCSGDGYSLARSLGHSLVPPVPALTPLPADRKRLKGAAGVRCRGSAGALVDGLLIRREEGELQFTEQAVSGIPAFQISRILTRALEEGRSAGVLLDFLPEYDKEALEKEAAFRRTLPDSMTLQEVFGGLVHPGILRMVLGDLGLQNEMKKRKISDARVLEILEGLKDFRLAIDRIPGFDRAQTTAGGVPLEEVERGSFRSRLREGLYRTGELLDVDGICGGYNLHWAMASGYLAAKSITERAGL